MLRMTTLPAIRYILSIYIRICQHRCVVFGSSRNAPSRQACRDGYWRFYRRGIMRRPPHTICRRGHTFSSTAAEICSVHAAARLRTHSRSYRHISSRTTPCLLRPRITAARHTASYVADDPGDGADVYMPRRRYRRKHRDSVTCSGAAATRTHAKTPPLRAGCVATSNVTAVRRHAAWPYTHEVIACTAKGLVGYNF